MSIISERMKYNNDNKTVYNKIFLDKFENKTDTMMSNMIIDIAISFLISMCALR